LEPTTPPPGAVFGGVGITAPQTRLTLLGP
jgi:hypothetical protein